MAPMYEESIRDEFAGQSDSFADSPAMSAAETLGVLVDLAPADASARWLETACGPGLIAGTGATGGLCSRDRPDSGDARARRRQLRRRDHPLQPPSHPGAGAGGCGDGPRRPFGGMGDFNEWLGRGSGGAASAPLIESLLAEAPANVKSFRVVDEGDGRRLKLRYSLLRWRVPGQS
jgi:hypothetical protein